MRRLALSLSILAFATGFLAPTTASAQQSVNFFIGGFNPRSLDARASDDVLVNNLSLGENSLDFNIKDFNGVTVGGEWLVGLGDWFDAGLGLGYYQRTAPSVYLTQINMDGSEIAQDLKLRIVPFTATVRFLPLGHRAPIQPYVGGGVGIFAWRYSETGQFVDPSDHTIFTGNFVGSGTNAGPVVLGGVTVPIANVGIGGEIRYQSAKGSLPASQEFAGPKIDLGGWNYLFIVKVRF
jgi:hypothetical protein